MLANRFMTLPEPFESVAREMDQVFDQVLGSSLTGQTTAQAPVALWEDDQHVYLEVEVPGLRQEDLELTIREGRLFISGERKPTEKKGKCWFNERQYGRFERIVALSDMIDPQSIEAELCNGVLSLTLHKKPEAQPQRITIRVREQKDQPRLETQTAETAESQPGDSAT